MKNPPEFENNLKLLAKLSTFLYSSTFNNYDLRLSGGGEDWRHSKVDRLDFGLRGRDILVAAVWSAIPQQPLDGEREFSFGIQRLPGRDWDSWRLIITSWKENWHNGGHFNGKISYEMFTAEILTAFVALMTWEYEQVEFRRLEKEAELERERAIRTKIEDPRKRFNVCV